MLYALYFIWLILDVELFQVPLCRNTLNKQTPLALLFQSCPINFCNINLCCAVYDSRLFEGRFCKLIISYIRPKTTCYLLVFPDHDAVPVGYRRIWNNSINASFHKCRKVWCMCYRWYTRHLFFVSVCFRCCLTRSFANIFREVAPL